MTKGAGLLALEAGTPEQQARAASVYQCFLDAGDIWARRLEDSMKVNLTVDYADLSPGVLGQSTTQTIGKDYVSVRSALQADATTSYDALAVSYLQDGSALDMLINDTSQTLDAPVMRDNDTSANNTLINLSRTTAKALGLLPANQPAEDGAITFSGDYSWDFDRSDGIDGNSFDFTGTAVHEIGHLLGFSSGVDAVDYNSAPEGPNAPQSLQNYRVLSVRDLYRYSAASLAEPNQPTNGAVLDITTEDGSYLSLDGGQTILGTLASGNFNGDGYQASHWTYGSGQGIMVPAIVEGVQTKITSLDLTVFDVIGYNRSAASLGDFNADSAADATDIDMILDAFLAGSSDLNYDVSFDESFDWIDVAVLLEEFVGATFADANLDGATDIADFVVLKQNYGAVGAGWATGDFTGEGDVDINDFVVLKQNYGRTVAALTAAGADYVNLIVPEPGSLALLLAGGLPVLRRRRG